MRKLFLSLLLTVLLGTTIAYAEFSIDFYTFNAAYDYYYNALLEDEGLSHPQDLSYTPDISPKGSDGLFSSDMPYGTVYLNPYDSLNVDGVFSIVYDQAWNDDNNYFASSNLFALVLALEYTPDTTETEILSIGEAVINNFYDFIPDANADQGTCYTGKFNHELFDLKDGRIALLSWRNDGTPDYYDDLHLIVSGAISTQRLAVAVEKTNLEADPYQVVTNSLAIRQSVANSMGMKSWLHTYKYDALNDAIDKVNEDIERILANEKISEQDIAVANALLTLAGDLHDEVAALTDR